jgi:aminopeptidase N
MSRDAVATTHPVVQHVETVEQASQAFDAITYEKGAAVIRMLEGYVGPEAWRSGVRSYVKQHAYGNTVSDDLWRAVETAAGKPILDIAHDFTLQPGVPLIRVATEACSGGKTTLQLTQDEFTKDRPGKTSLKWRVPVIAQAVGGKPVRTLVNGGAGTLEVPGCGSVVVNAGQSGYYRTLYTAKDFAALRDDFAKIAPIDQLGLMGNTWALGMSGLQPASDYLELVDATPANADPQIWGGIAGNLQSLHNYYRGDAARQKTFESFAVKRLAPVFAHIGWEARAGETAPVTNLRTQLIGTLANLGDASVIAEARRRYAVQGSDPKAVPAELRRTILGVVASHADAATWDKLHAAAQAETSAQVKDQMYRLLSEAKDPALARRALELALTDEPGATNSAGMVSVVSGEHPDMAFDYALAHREQLDKKIDTTSSSRYYPRLGDGSLDAAMIGKIQTYADKYVAASSRRDAETAIANIKYRMQVRNEQLPSIDAWLAQHAK